MNTSPQMTSVEPTIRIPAWRRASPKNLKTRSPKISRRTWPMNLTSSPKLSTQPRGAAMSSPISSSQPIGKVLPGASLRDRGDLRMGGQQRLREGVVEGEDAVEGDDDRLIDGSPHPLGATGRSHPLVTADDRDDRSEDRRLQDRPPQVGGGGVVEERGPERTQRGVVDQRGQDPSKDPEQQRVDVEQTGDHHQGQEAGHDQVLDRVDAQDLKRVQLLA